MRNICARFAQDFTYFPNTQYCARFAQDCTSFLNAQSDLRKIVLIVQCAIYAQDCTYFSNAQYMCKICARLYFFPQCAIYAQDCTSSNAQDLRKIVLLSPMHNICARIVLLSPVRNICARFAQDCTYFSNAQYMCKICARLYLTSNLKC